YVSFRLDIAGRSSIGAGRLASAGPNTPMWFSVCSWLATRPLLGYSVSQFSCAISGPSASLAAGVWQRLHSAADGYVQDTPFGRTLTFPPKSKSASVPA